MRVRLIVGLVLAVCGASVACSPRHDPAPAAPAAARPAVATPAAPTPTPAADPGLADPAVPAPEPGPDREDERRTNDALAVAADEAERAPRGADECENAHNQLVAMLTAVEREMSQPMHRPERGAFLEVCREMPAEARRCIVPTYAMEHQDVCTAALEALPDDVQQRFQTVINGPG